MAETNLLKLARDTKDQEAQTHSSKGPQSNAFDESMTHAYVDDGSIDVKWEKIYDKENFIKSLEVALEQLRNSDVSKEKINEEKQKFLRAFNLPTDFAERRSDQTFTSTVADAIEDSEYWRDANG